MENKSSVFSILSSLDRPLISIPCLCISYLFLLPNISNLHAPAPTLERVNLERLDPNRCHPNMWLWQMCRWILWIRRSGYARCGYVCFDPIALEIEAGRSLWFRDQSCLQSKLWDSQGCYTEEPASSPPPPREEYHVDWEDFKGSFKRKHLKFRIFLKVYVHVSSGAFSFLTLCLGCSR